jgi:membrane-associated phospholipid phosphatase
MLPCSRGHRALRISSSIRLPCRVPGALVALLVLAVPVPAAASPTSAHELEHVAPAFLALELGGSLAFSGALFLAAGAPAATCGWCASNGFDEAMRDLLRADNPRAPAGLSHAFSTAAAPALALGALVPPALATGDGREALENVVIALDSVIVTLGITHATKRTFDRERPAVHHHVVAATEYSNQPNQWNQSFFSGDTSVAFAAVSSATTLAYLRGYKVAPYVLALGGVIGLGTAWLRVAADMHWASDVLTGAAIGTGVGFSLPYFVHARRAAAGEQSLVVVPQVAPGELTVRVGGTF